MAKFEEPEETLRMRPNTAKEFRRILDCFSGADGGASFWATRQLVELMDERAAKGDKAAEGVIGVLHQFAQIVKIAGREFGGRGIDL